MMSYWGVKKKSFPLGAGDDTLTVKVDEWDSTFEADSEAGSFFSYLIETADTLDNDEYLVIGAVRF